MPEHLAQALSEVDASDAEVAEALAALEQELRDLGRTETAEELKELLGGVDESEEKPSRWSRLWSGVRGATSKQLGLMGQEISESVEAVGLLRRRLTGDIKKFTDDEAAVVKEQFGDLLRGVPATALALAPVPGMALLTPLILGRLGLLPSAWRDAGRIDHLERLAADLEAKGDTGPAERMRKLAEAMREKNHHRAERIRVLREHPSLRLLYDFDGDGQLDEEEWAAIDEDIRTLGRLVAEDEDEAVWFYTAYGEVEGPVRLHRLLEMPLPEQTLFKRKPLKRWLPLDLLDEVAQVAEALDPDDPELSGRTPEPT